MKLCAEQKLMTDDEWESLSPESRHRIGTYVMKLEAFWGWSGEADQSRFENEYYGRDIVHDR